MSNDQSIINSSQNVNVDDVVKQASDVQDLFQQNDQLNSSQPIVNNVMPVSSTQSGTVNDASVASIANDDTSTNDKVEKSPLEMLEEILNKNNLSNQQQDIDLAQESKAAEEQSMQQKLENEAMIEAARQKMLRETNTAEQQKRDAIRIEQLKANSVVNPYEIRQLQHSKIQK